MSSEHIIVGVAGHVDHGKTLLTTRLTGVDTDRLPEEKKRGMTIVPGFVSLDLKSGRRLGIIDVPGHERFVKNMLAGVAGVDMALLVIAADEGVMPQTEEHLNILHLLGISRGIVAITKCDLVDDEWLELIHEQVAEQLAPTLLKDAPIIDVSALAGQNIDKLIDLLDEVSAAVTPRPFTGLCRMPVDRVFTKQGFGTIATGTLWAGSIENGQKLTLHPSGDELRVRGLQVHDIPVEKALAGQRTAINLAGPGAQNAVPGSWLSQEGLLKETYRMDTELTLLKGAKDLAQRARVRIFHGTSEVLGRVRLLDRKELKAGDTCLCQLELEAPLFPLRGDRVIIRSYSPMVTIAGATVLDTAPPRYRLSSPKTMETIKRKSGLDAGEALLNIMQQEPGLYTAQSLAKAAQLTLDEVSEAIADLTAKKSADLITVDGAENYTSSLVNAGWKETAVNLLSDFHTKYPLRRGLPAAELRQRVFGKINTKQLSALLSSYEEEGLISVQGALVSKAGFEPKLTDKEAALLDSVHALYKKDKFTPPDWALVMEERKVHPALAAEYLIWMLENGKLTSVGDLHFTPQAVKEAEDILRSRFTEFTMAEARDALNSTRKYVITLMESFDSRKITIRNGDTRRFLR